MRSPDRIQADYASLRKLHASTNEALDASNLRVEELRELVVKLEADKQTLLAELATTREVMGQALARANADKQRALEEAVALRRRLRGTVD